MPRVSVDHALGALVADDRRDDRERRAFEREARPLLVVELEPGAGKSAASDPSVRADAAPLLLAERDDAERPSSPPEPFGRLQRSEYAERPVEAAALRHRVEVRARPDFRKLRLQTGEAADEVAVAVDLDLEARLEHPVPDEPVGLVLAGGVARAVGTRPSPDRVDRVEALLEVGGHQPSRAVPTPRSRARRTTSCPIATSHGAIPFDLKTTMSVSP